MDASSRFYQYLSASTALLSMITGGMHYAWPSPSIPKLTQTNSSAFQITPEEGSWIIIMELIAPIPSCFFSAIITDNIGRKKSILSTSIPYFVSWLIIAFAKSASMLCLARFLAGLCDGVIFTVMPLYIAEIADPNIRGFLGAGISVVWIFGMLLINVIGAYLTIPVTACVSSVVPLVMLATFIWMPESPYFLIMKNDIKQATLSLQKLKGRNDVEDELQRLQNAVKTNNKKWSNFLELLTKKSNQKSLLIIVVLRNAQQMSGLAAIIFYTISIFNEAGDFMSPLGATILYVSIQCVMAAVCSLLIDKTGRRPLLTTSLVGSALTLFLEGTYFYLKDFTNVDTTVFNFVPLLALISFVIVFNVGAQPIPMLIQGEIFPTNVKAMASCFSEVYCCVVAAIISKLFQILKDSFGMFLPFYVFAGCCVLNLIFVTIFVPETKRRTLEEIQETLGEKKAGVKC
ncbi:hypothetical protein Zmor_009904 [Zophobas morio]|uniref:Major facilitator superfamily (MFS) profile domain-containing protein n=1 Tax=Zophobas morio TaxID=2755281 RepID=A0AA38MJ65_9CUCU|nr:hypothetical protein Zmor_009904 [Zophobas morio]